MKDNRKKYGSKFDRFFYNSAIIIFCSIAIISFLHGIYSGFTNEKIVMILMNSWFMLFTMNMITMRFKRKNEQYFWHNWAIFKRKILQKPLGEYKGEYTDAHTAAKELFAEETSENSDETKKVG